MLTQIYTFSELNNLKLNESEIIFNQFNIEF